MNVMVPTTQRLREAESELEDVLRRSFYETCRLFYWIRSEQLYRDEYAGFDDYCQKRWDFSGGRGRQLAEAYEVCKNLAMAASSDDVPLFFQDWLTGLGEAHTRVLKQLPPGQQADAWMAAKAVDERPTASVVDKIVQEFKASPKQIEAMPAAEQRQMLHKIETAATRAYSEQRLQEYANLTIKRLKRAIADGKQLGAPAADVVAVLEQATAMCQGLLGKAPPSDSAA